MLLPALAKRPAPVIVASKADTEGALLGSLIALVLEREGIPVETRLQLGPTRAVRSAILSGAIHVYPEYTGNGAFFHDMAESPAWRSPTSAYETVRRLDAERHGLVWLERAPANNTWLIAVRGDVARRDNLLTMEDFARAVRQSAAIRLAASAEFVESPAALPAFERAYDFRFPRDRIVVLSGGDTAHTMRAAAQGAGGVNAAMVYGTDGAIAALDLVVMKDTRGAQIVYEPAPVIRAEVLQRHPGVAKALAPVFASLTMTRLQALNAEIVIEGRPPREVAGRYLEQVVSPR
ncbi:MAG TPA: ABC transporter substrate-binding protein [Microvirga sp.]|nr:ABC transporter substrate-binding protein [Microvirga sp.]